MGGTDLLKIKDDQVLVSKRLVGTVWYSSSDSGGSVVQGETCLQIAAAEAMKHDEERAAEVVERAAEVFDLVSAVEKAL